MLIMTAEECTGYFDT